ncbi:MAG: sugar phosphate isomerase/epimerase family protein [Peptoniphilus sp.]|nr:sugar phosphate isomerase/epimerase family protein [Peptoniphilus sp.]
MSFYFASTLMWDFSVEEIFDFAKENNFSGIEFWAEQIRNRAYSPDEIKISFEKNNLNLTLHASSWDLNLCALNKSIRQTSVDEIKRDIDLAHFIGIDEITVHPGRMSVALDSFDYGARLHDSLKEICQYAHSKGIQISLEIMEKVPKEFITSLEQVQNMAEDLMDSLKITLDVAHCDSIEEAYDVLKNAKNLSKVHISNRRENKYHTALDDGIFDLVEILTHMQELKLPMVIEGLETGKETKFLKRNINYLKELNLL